MCDSNQEGFSEMAPNDNNNFHPWPEWVNFMEHLLKKGYYYHERNEYPFGQNEMGHKDSNLIRTTCLNFGRDRFDVIRYLSKKDIQVVVRCGCPSLDRKVVNSGKRLRAYLGMDRNRRLLDILGKVTVDDIMVILSVANMCAKICEILVMACVDIVVKSDLDSVTLEKGLPHDIVKQVMDSRLELGLVDTEIVENRPGA